MVRNEVGREVAITQGIQSSKRNLGDGTVLYLNFGGVDALNCIEHKLTNECI